MLKNDLPEFNFKAQPHEMLGIDKTADHRTIMNAYWSKMSMYDPNLHADKPKEHVDHCKKISTYINGAKNSMLRNLRKSEGDASDSLVEVLAWATDELYKLKNYKK